MSISSSAAAAIASESANVFRDYNVYHPGAMKWLGTSYAPEQWDAFRSQAMHDEHSRIGPVTVAEDGTVTFPAESAAKGIEKTVGPTAPVVVEVARQSAPVDEQHTPQTTGD